MLNGGAVTTNNAVIHIGGDHQIRHGIESDLPLALGLADDLFDSTAFLHLGLQCLVGLRKLVSARLDGFFKLGR